MERINDKEQQITIQENKLIELKRELTILNNEKDSIEMKAIFETAKSNNLSFNDVIKLIQKQK